MKLKTRLSVALLMAALPAFLLARADAREGREGGHEEHGGGEHHAAPARPVERQAPPRFQPHPPGTHPRGATVHAHPMRVLAPRTVKYGSHAFRHWEHPEFARPAYYWEWSAIHSVSCTAEDSYGDQYPVTESTFAGFGMNNMTGIEDDALDRCYQESGGDQSCYLATCSHY